jgi:hypothetical protein
VLSHYLLDFPGLPSKSPRPNNLSLTHWASFLEVSGLGFGNKVNGEKELFNKLAFGERVRHLGKINAGFSHHPLQDKTVHGHIFKFPMKS